MSSSLFQTNNQQNGTMIDRFLQFKNSLAGQNPKKIVQDMLATGRMTKQQYDELCKQARQLQGLLK